MNSSPVSDPGVGFGGLDLNLQYKFITASPLQPYGKVGAGDFDDFGPHAAVRTI